MSGLDLVKEDKKNKWKLQNKKIVIIINIKNNIINYIDKLFNLKIDKFFRKESKRS